MWRWSFWTLSVCISVCATVTAQDSVSKDLPASGPVIVELSAAPSERWQCWGRAEYLLWWMQDAPLPIPLVTTGSAIEARPGATGQPGTQVLLGNANLGTSPFSGMRFTLGSWCDAEQMLGIEGVGILLPTQSHRRRFGSDASGNPLLAIPFFNQAPGTNREDAHLISSPGNSSGGVLVTSSLQWWGVEGNGVLCLWRDAERDCQLLTGFRYADLHERLAIQKDTRFLVAPPPVNTVISTNDLFNTRNQFYGAELGGRFLWRHNRCFMDVTGKIGLGATQQTVDIRGDSARAVPGTRVIAGRVVPATVTTFPGGLLAQASNIGQRSSAAFTVIPALEFNLGYQLTERIGLFVGYDVLYWSSVIRPGNQIDRNLNLTQSTLLGAGTLTGPAAPAALFDRSDFWVHGVNFGIAWHF